MKYFKMIFYTTGSDYETMEKLIDEISFRKIQQALANGSDMLIMEDRVIRRNQIKEIISADEEVNEYKRVGLNIDKYFGLNSGKGIELKEGEKGEELKQIGKEVLKRFKAGEN
jgi:hypothetical protein